MKTKEELTCNANLIKNLVTVDTFIAFLFPLAYIRREGTRYIAVKKEEKKIELEFAPLQNFPFPFMTPLGP